MRLTVAALFVVTCVALLTTTTHAQTTHRGASKTTTVKICQGVPIPEGYIVVAYLTSSACPHGAYLIKKQDADPY